MHMHTHMQRGCPLPTAHCPLPKASTPSRVYTGVLPAARAAIWAGELLSRVGETARGAEVTHAIALTLTLALTLAIALTLT